MDKELQRWLAQEKTVLEVLNAGPGPGAASPDQLAGLTGLELMQAMLAAGCPSPPSPRRWTS
jgi:hypothetical protein